MFANLVQLITRRPPAEFERGFVQDVRVSRPRQRNRRTERILLIGWVLILFKSFLVLWAVQKYHMNFNANWVIVPTVIAALLCTAVYFRQE
jgi:hypothetical protein